MAAGKIIRILLGIIIFIIVFSLWFIVSSMRISVYHYESSDRGMEEIEVPGKGRSLEMVEAYFEEYKKWKGDPTITLCRTSKRIWYAPAFWWDNFTNKRWKLPYIEPSPKPNTGYYVEMLRAANQDETSSQHDAPVAVDQPRQ
ncbi:MAG: hypothetical protein AB1656_18990 [Candidatus Omnitrophota bacterium]